ncbi:MAG: energy transducer TonB [Pseudomonadota bacterium]
MLIGLLRVATLFLAAAFAASASDALLDGPTGPQVSNEILQTARISLSQARAEHGEKSLPAARLQARLGVLLMLAERPAEARRELEPAVVGLQRHLGVFAAELFEPYTYLGLSEQALGRHEEAADAFSRGQHISHRHQGLLNEEQVPLVLAKAASLDVLGERWEVEQLYRNAIKLRQKNSGAGAPETVQAISTLGLWLTMQGRYYHALTLFRSARKQLEETQAAAVPELLTLLRGNAVALVYAPPAYQSSALDLLREAKELAGTRPEALSPEQRFAAVIGLADMLMMFSREREALEVYQEAWALAKLEPVLGDATIIRLKQQKLVRGPFLPLDPDHLEGQVWFRVAFDLRADGRPSRIRIVDSNARLKSRRAAKEYFQKTRFRPLLSADGAPLPRKDQEIWVAFAEPSIPLS